MSFFKNKKSVSENKLNTTNSVGTASASTMENSDENLGISKSFIKKNSLSSLQKSRNASFSSEDSYNFDVTSRITNSLEGDEQMGKAIRVVILAARSLKATSHRGYSNPLVKLSFMGQTGKTRTIQKTVDPVWRESFTFIVLDDNTVLPSIKSGHSGASSGSLSVLDDTGSILSDETKSSLQVDGKNDTKDSFLRLKIASDDPGIGYHTLGNVKISFDEIHSGLYKDPVWVRCRSKDEVLESVICLKAISFNKRVGKIHRKVKSQTVLSSKNSDINEDVYNSSTQTKLDKIAEDAGSEVISFDNTLMDFQTEEDNAANSTNSWQLWIQLYKGRNIQSRIINTPRFPVVEFELKNVHNESKHHCKSSQATDPYAPIWNERFIINLESSTHSFKVIVRSVIQNKLVPDFDIGTITLPLAELKCVTENQYVVPQWRALNNNVAKGELLMSAYMVPQLPHNIEMTAVLFDPFKYNEQNSGSKAGFERFASQFHKLRVSILSGRNVTAPGNFLQSKVRSNLLKPRIVGTILYTNQKQKTHYGSSLPNPIWDQSNRHLTFDIHDLENDVLKLTLEMEHSSGLAPTYINGGYCDISVSKVHKIKKGEVPQDVEPIWVDIKRDNHSSVGQLLVRLVYMSDYDYNKYVKKNTEDTNVNTAILSENKSYIGKLRIKLHGAKDLRLRLASASLSDAFVIINYMNFWRRTITIRRTKIPEWEEEFTFPVLDPAHPVYIYVFDGDGNYCIGMMMFAVSQLECNTMYSKKWVPLTKTSKKNIFKSGGSLNLSVQFHVPSLPKLLLCYVDPIIQPDEPSDLAIKAELSTNKIEKDLYNQIKSLQTQNEFLVVVVKSHIKRLQELIERLSYMADIFNAVAEWEQPGVTIIVSIIYIILCLNSDLIIPVFSLAFGFYLYWNHSMRPCSARTLPQRQLPQLIRERLDEEDLKASQLEEENEKKFKNPIQQLQQIINTIKDAMITVQNKLGEIASPVESVFNIVKWEDTRATGIIAALSVLLGFALLTILPTRYFMIGVGLFVLRHPVLRTPGSVPVNFITHVPNHGHEMALLFN